MSIATIITLMQKTMGFEDNGLLAAIRFIGEAGTSMLLSLLFAVYSMGLARKIPMKDIMESCTSAILHIGMMLLIIGAEEPSSKY